MDVADFDMPLAQVEEIECQVAQEVYGDREWPDQPNILNVMSDLIRYPGAYWTTLSPV